MRLRRSQRIGHAFDGSAAPCVSRAVTRPARDHPPFPHAGPARTSPLGWVSDGNGGWLIAASASSAAGNPAWYHNLAAAPDKARIEVNGATIPVSAEQLYGTEREAAWQTLTAGVPRFGRYAEKTDREIPVIRLTPRSS